MKLELKKASLVTNSPIFMRSIFVQGVLLIVKKYDDEKEDIGECVTDYIPDEIFVGLDSKPIFYTNNYHVVGEMLCEYDPNVLSFDDDYISRSYHEKESGLFVNFFQPSEHYQGDPVYVTVSKEPLFGNIRKKGDVWLR